MERKIRKAAQLNKIFSQFNEENKESLIRTAKCLLKIQHDSKTMIVLNDTYKEKPERSEL